MPGSHGSTSAPSRSLTLDLTLEEARAISAELSGSWIPRDRYDHVMSFLRKLEAALARQD